MIAVTKTQQILISLVAVIPAGFLGYQLVLAMLFSAASMSMVAYIIIGITLLSVLATIGTLVGVVFGGNRKPAPVMTVVSGASKDSIEEMDDDVAIGDGSSASFDAQDVLAESSEFELGDSSHDLLDEVSESELDTEAVNDLDDFDLEDEPKPKKKKR